MYVEVALSDPFNINQGIEFCLNNEGYLQVIYLQVNDQKCTLENVLI